MARLGQCIALLGLAVVAVWVYLSLDRPVRHVEVVGNLLPVEALDVERRLTELKPKRLLSTDLDGLREHLLKLSWPEVVEIRRVWPDTIQIRITPKLVVAKWGSQGYLTAAGDLVTRPDRSGGVPLLDCEVASPQKALETYRYLQDIVSENGLEISALVQNTFGEWQLTLSNGVRAHLGLDLRRSRVQRFVRVHRHLADVSAVPVRYLDLRYANGVAVRFDESPMIAGRCVEPIEGQLPGAVDDACDSAVPRS